MVLLVDGVTGNLKRLADCLRAADLQLRFATDAAMVVETLGHVRPELVLLNIELPDMDGRELLRRIRATETAEKLPVILTGRPSGDPDEARARGDARSDAIAMGAADFIALPFQSREVRTRVRRLLPGVSNTGTSLHKLIDQLDELLGSGSTRALMILPRLTAAFGDPVPSLLPRLTSQVEGFDFKAARETLRRL
jgi:PleD family two-component response regulator